MTSAILTVFAKLNEGQSSRLQLFSHRRLILAVRERVGPEGVDRHDAGKYGEEELLLDNPKPTAVKGHSMHFDKPSAVIQVNPLLPKNRARPGRPGRRVCMQHNQVLGLNQRPQVLKLHVPLPFVVIDLGELQCSQQVSFFEIPEELKFSSQVFCSGGCECGL